MVTRQGLHVSALQIFGRHFREGYGLAINVLHQEIAAVLVNVREGFSAGSFGNVRYKLHLDILSFLFPAASAATGAVVNFFSVRR
jgi:hypothetical protein